MMRWRRVAIAVALAGAGALLAGCESIGYYAQSIGGHLSLMAQSKPLSEALDEARATNDSRLVQRLGDAQRIREFASRELGLPNNGSYRRYANLHRPYVVWNVFAAPPLSLKLKEWCFPVVGCITYRGYYDQKDAQAYADALRQQGFDVHVGGIPAYSTLGYFDDPILNTFIYLPEGELARMIFHELAHQVVYVKNDTTFNESFATAVELAGVERWLTQVASPDARATYVQYDVRHVAFRKMLLDTRAKLDALYADTSLSDETKLARKAQLFDALRASYQQLKAEWGGYSGYDRWFAQPLTNAHLAAIATYQQWVPAFTRMLAQDDHDLPRFYRDVEALSRLDKPVRDARLRALTEAGLAGTAGVEQSD